MILPDSTASHATLLWGHSTVFTYLLGPFLAMLPRRWRNALPFSGAIRWTKAAALSGLLESFLALVAMVFWYSHSTMIWIDHAAGEAAQGKMGPEVNTHALGFVAWSIMMMQPLTWIIFCFALEGAVRFSSAAFSGGIFGILPLAIVDTIIRKLTGVEPDALRPPELKPTLSSVGGAMRDKFLTARIPAGADELRFLKSAAEEILEIHATRRKPDWDPPRVVRFADKYYRLEQSNRGRPPRPFVYTLRRLAAGVPSRNVILYSPQDAVTTLK